MFHLGEFTFLTAENPSILENIHRYRFKIFVEEYGFENAKDHGNGLEKDKFDSHSTFIAAMDRKGDLVGTVRLIVGPKDLPALTFADPEQRARLEDGSVIAEVSRFAMSRHFQSPGLNWGKEMSYFMRQTGSTVQSKTFAFPESTSARNIVILGLIHAAILEAQKIGAKHFVIMVERPFWVILRRHGLPFEPIGPEVEYHGKRRAYTCLVKDAARSAFLFREKVAELLSKNLKTVSPLHERVLSDTDSFRIGPFLFSTASSETALKEAHRLRYRAFRQFARLAHSADCLGGMEKDRYDPWSVQAIALDGKGRTVGTARLVLSSPLGFKSFENVPLESLSPLLSSKKIGEFSKLALDPLYGTAAADLWSALVSLPLLRLAEEHPPITPTLRNQSSMIVLGLFRMLYRVSKKLRLTGWVFQCGPATLDLIHRNGVKTQAIVGPRSSFGLTAHWVRIQEAEKTFLHFPNLRHFAKDIKDHYRLFAYGNRSLNRSSNRPSDSPTTGLAEKTNILI